MKIATLCFLVKDGKVLLGMKKRGFGQGKYNGFGGKVVDGESIEQAALRELAEEAGVRATRYAKMAELDFRFSQKSEWDQVVHVFLVAAWEGEPRESEEMTAEWFAHSEIPYGKMWVDDKHWLPHVIEGKNVSAEFLFTPDGSQILEKKIKTS